jgi:hypothetical protein
MIQYLLTMMLQRAPVLLVLLGGMIFAVVRWRRHPKVSLLTLVALALYLIKLLLFTALSYAVPQIRESMHLSYAVANNMFEVLSVLSDISFAVIIVLLVAAAFIRRGPLTVTNT